MPTGSSGRSRRISSAITRRSLLRRGAVGFGAVATAGAFSVPGSAAAASARSSNGTTVWREVFTTPGLDRFDDAIQTARGTFVAVGTITRENGKTAGLLVEITADGIIVRTRQLVDGIETRLYRIEPTVDGGYLLCGRTEIEAADEARETLGLLVKLTGDFTREYTFTDPSFRFQFPMAVELADGTIVATSTQFASGTTAVALVGIDPEAARVRWTWRPYQQGRTFAYDLQTLDDRAVVLLARRELPETTPILATVDGSGATSELTDVPAGRGRAQFDLATIDDRVMFVDSTDDGDIVIREFDAQLQSIRNVSISVGRSLGQSLSIDVIRKGRYHVAGTPACARGGSPVLVTSTIKTGVGQVDEFDLPGHCVDDLIALPFGRALLFGRTESATTPSDAWIALVHPAAVGSSADDKTAEPTEPEAVNSATDTDPAENDFSPGSIVTTTEPANAAPAPQSTPSPSPTATTTPGFGIATSLAAGGLAVFERWLRSRRKE